MGHREDLLAGAKRCLFERGYARTTARDIVAASGTNLASIGYHFGSKEALMTQALIEALTESTAEAELASPVRPEDPARDRLAAAWRQLVTSATTHRHLWLASFEAFLVGEHRPELLTVLADLHDAQRRELAAEFLAVPAEEVPEETANTLGALLLAMAAGLTLQNMVAPGKAPGAEQLVAGLRRLTAEVDGEK
ncbi:AcrR family transcriptional regulator [Crossiella equi]|uniref:AcrR family transcriptional regulator n=2 Tax=Crossiella equi TaxID=130796 RepID=A0ABS5ALF1_9PSEU|nr:TetR family transcriptional regulator [Crossiella equi]MBP2477092.1 AcrR family transcriptional regulator [Crossiella equi]